MSLIVACYLWRDPEWKHSGSFVYGPEHVRMLQKSVAKHLRLAHEFVCVTDRPEWFADDKDIRVVALDNATHVPGREWAKLMTFHPNGPELFGGDRILQLDLDAIICGNIDMIAMRKERIVLWRNPARIPWDAPDKFTGRAYHNGSIIFHRLGTAPHVWEWFVDNTQEIVGKLRDTQAWMAVCLGRDLPYWDQNDGIYRLERDDTPGSGIRGALPENARIVFFPGSEHKPWLPQVRERWPWIADYWPLEPAAA